MYNDIYECMAGGGAYASFVRVELAGGGVITKPSAVLSKSFDGHLFACLGATLTADELGGGRIARLGLTDREGGGELLGGAASGADGGELEREVSVTVSLATPRGWLGSESLFDMLVGITPFRGEFKIRSDQGEIAATPTFSSDGVSFAFESADPAERLTLTADGEDALTVEATENAAITVSAAFDGEYHPETGGRLVSASSGGAAVRACGIAAPTAVGRERRIGAFGGRLAAFGDWLALIDANEIRVYGADFSLTASRSASGITDCSVTDGGAFAFADSSRVLVCRGCENLAEINAAATSVALTETSGGLRLHYLSGGRLIGVDIRGGTALPVYDRESDCSVIVDRLDCVFGVGDRYARHYSASGELLGSSAVVEGTITGVRGKSRGQIVLRTTTRSWLVTPNAQWGVGGDVKAFSGRTLLTEENGRTQLKRFDVDSDRTVCELSADDMAFSDRLYYKRSNTLYARDALGTSLHIVADGANGQLTATVEKPKSITRGKITLRIGL